MKMLGLCLLLLTNVVYAERFNTRIHDYNGDHGFIRFENGRVGYLTPADRAKSRYSLILEGTSVTVDLDDDNIIRNVRRNSQETRSPELLNLENTTAINYEPTVISDMSTLNLIFDRLNPDFKRISECSDRAHVWAYDEYNNHGIKSEKVFIFFTASYINRHRFKWWFHVAPLMTVNNDGVLEKKVLDFRYMSGPASIKEWTDLMVYSRRTCKETTKFSEYDVNPQTEDCYLMVDSMYYRLPLDLHNQETQNKYRNSFYPSEISFSSRAAFHQSTRSENE
jgi:hypothetical protein